MSTNPFFSIEDAITVIGGDESLRPAGVDLQERTINLNIIRNSGNPNQWNNSRTWLIVHGWNAAIGDFNEIAEAITRTNPEDTVLLLDWTEASGGSAEDAKVGDIFNGGVLVAASWIGSVAEKVAQQLKDWGLDPSSLNLVGHSIGSLMASEIAWQLKNTQELGNVQSITALDPPSEAGLCPTTEVLDLATGQPILNPIATIDARNAIHLFLTNCLTR